MMIHMNDLDLLSDLIRTNLNAEAAFTVCAHKTKTSDWARCCWRAPYSADKPRAG